MYLDINEFYYHKTIKKDDVTHIVDVNNQYLGYMVNLSKQYVDYLSKEEVLNQLIFDLREKADEIEYELLNNNQRVR